MKIVKTEVFVKQNMTEYLISDIKNQSLRVNIFHRHSQLDKSSQINEFYFFWRKIMMFYKGKYG